MAAVICDLIGDICRPICSGVSFGFREVFKSPFLPYLALTFALNTPGVVYGLKSIGSACNDLKGWLLPNAFFCLLHMIAAYYIVNKIREPSKSDLPTTNDNDTSQEPTTATTGFSLMPNEDAPGEENSFQRIKHVLCYGELIDSYLLLFWSCLTRTFFFLQTKTWQFTSSSSSFGLSGCQWGWRNVSVLPTVTVTTCPIMWTSPSHVDTFISVSLGLPSPVRCAAWGSAHCRERIWHNSCLVVTILRNSK